MVERWKSAFLLVAAGLGPTAPWAASSSKEGSVARPPEAVASGLPFRLHQEALIVVDGSIGSASGLRFLIDTGAMRTVVDRRVARKLGLEAVDGTVLLVAVNESRHAEQVVVPELRFGPIRMNGLRALEGDLLFLSPPGTQIDAIIGLDVLRSSSFRVDYAAKRIAFGALPATSTAVPFEPDSALLIVTAQVDDQPMRLMIDTGARNLVFFDGHAQAKLPRLPWRFAAIQTPTARSYVRETLLSSVRLGATEWSQRPALLMKVPALADRGLDGILAPSALRLKRVDFDFERNLLGLAR